MWITKTRNDKEPEKKVPQNKKFIYWMAQIYQPKWSLIPPQILSKKWRKYDVTTPN